MLTLIEGGFFGGGSDYIKSEIQRRAEGKARAYLIVPEQQTVLAEAEYTDLLPGDYPLYFEVTNFTRLCDTVARSLGGLAKESADSLRRALIIFRVLSELRPALRTFGAKETTPGTVTKTIAALRKLSALSLGEDALNEAKERLSEEHGGERLTDKLYDLIAIKELYDKLLDESYSGAEDSLIRTARLIRECPECPPFKACEIYIDGFTSFTEPQYMMISTLMSICDVTVNLTLPKAAKEAFEYTELRLAHDRLIREAGRAGHKVRLKHSETILDGSRLIRYEICNNIWRSGAKIDNDCLQYSDSVQIYEAENPYEECDFIAADIKRQVMEGASYSDFAVIARDIKRYEGILSLSFEKAGIPLFVSKDESIDSYELIKLISSAYRISAYGFTRRDVISYAKCSLSGVERELVDELELYAQRWQIEGERFTDGIIWNMNPDGFSGRWRDDAEEVLLRINDTKEKITAPLIRFSALARECRNVREHARLLFGFVMSLECESALKKKAEELYKLGEGAAAAGIEKIYGLLMDSLDTVVEVLGEVEVDVQGFQNILKILFSEVSVGQIPSYIDEVQAGSADLARFVGKKHIYLIGVNQGLFPARVTEDGYFSDNEISRLKAAGLEIEPEGTRKSAMEYYYFCRATALSEDTLTILYPVLDSGFKPLMPSEAVKRIREMLPSVKFTRLRDICTFDKSYSPSYALEHLSASGTDENSISEALIQCGYGPYIDLRKMPIKNVTVSLSRESIDKLYPGALYLTHTRLEGYSRCPMRYFCSSTLSLDEGMEAKWGTNNIGTFIHAVLENFFSILKERGRSVGELTDGEKKSLTDDAALKYIEQCFPDERGKSKRIEVLLSRLSKYSIPIVDSLCDEFSTSDFQPIFFECRIDEKKPDAPSPAVFKTDTGREVYIYGTIDRVDTYKSGENVYLRVVDYKTGKKSFSVHDLEKGENLQMFLYLKALCETEKPEFKKALGVEEGGRIIPAGVIYVKADISDVTLKGDEKNPEELIKDKQKRLGMILNDGESLRAMNPKYLPISFNKDGSTSKRSLDKLYDEDGWIKIGQTINTAVEKITGRLLSGDISADPLKKQGAKKACEYCKFKPICRNSKLF